MKKIILIAGAVFITGMLSTFTATNNAKSATAKVSIVAFGLRYDLATAD